MQAAHASAVGSDGYNPLLDVDVDRAAGSSQSGLPNHARDRQLLDADGSGSSHSNIFSIAAAHERAAAAHGASDVSLTSAVEKHEPGGNSTHPEPTRPAQQLDSQQHRQDRAPFQPTMTTSMGDEGHGSEPQGGRFHHESSRTTEEASISHMASRDGLDPLSGPQPPDHGGGATIEPRSVGGGGLAGRAAGSGPPHASPIHSALHHSVSQDQGASHVADESTTTGGYGGAGDQSSGLGRAGESACGLAGGNGMHHASSMDRLMQLPDDAEGRNGRQGNATLAGGDARLDLRCAFCLCVLV